MISICDPIYLKEAEDIIPSPSQTSSNYNMTLLYNSKLKKKFNVAFTHKVKNDLLDNPNLRHTLRREFKYTDDEIKNIIRNGRLPSLKDIKEMIKNRQYNEIDPYDVVAKSIISVEKEKNSSNIQNENTETELKNYNINTCNVTSVDMNSNKTFLTDVNLIENDHQKVKETEILNENGKNDIEELNNKILNNYRNESDVDLFNIDSYFDSDSDSDEDELNLGVQESLRALRHMLNCASVESYTDANYNKPTCNSKIRSNGWKRYRKGNVNIKIL